MKAAIKGWTMSLHCAGQPRRGCPAMAKTLLYEPVPQFQILLENIQLRLFLRHPGQRRVTLLIYYIFGSVCMYVRMYVGNMRPHRRT